MTASKIRVAVLGGGVGALTTAFELTSTPELRARYHVTVYQLGWRLGGKGASGRNQEIANRIEEHGLHIWMGFYENAFKLMREAYHELGRAPDEPLASWKEAFHQHSYIVLEEKLDGGFQPWNFVFPTNYLEPGVGGELPTPLAYAQMLVQWIIELWEGSLAVASPAASGSSDTPSPPSLPEWISRLISAHAGRARPGAVDHAKGHGNVLSATPPTPTHPVSALAWHVHHLLAARADGGHHAALLDRAIVWLIDAMMKLAWLFLAPTVNTSLESRKLWVGVNLAGSAAAGILSDDVLHKGWDSIDEHDLRFWLGRHGANSITLDSGPVRGIYDLAFAYIGGSTRDGAFAAGTAMRGMLRMVFTYKGSIFFRMQSGMGDVVAAPLYEVMRRRGVEFQFFHRVKALRLSEDKALVSRIELVKQVELPPGVEFYDPLFEVNDLPCWPSAPLYDRIADGAALKASGINLESAWAKPWKDERPLELELGRDFDQVVIGVSIAELKQIAQELMIASPALAACVEHVQTVQTQALQLWLDEDTESLGWQVPAGVEEGTVLGAFYEPIDTWADMSDLIPRETWPADSTPRSIAYFCGPLRDADPIPPYTEHAFPSIELGRYREMVLPFLDRRIQDLWPKATSPSGGFDWNLLVDLDAQSGRARLDSQYLRVNIDPTERYVLSVPRSTRFRLRANQLAFANVVLSGDWTYNGLNAGCVEAAVMGGMFASRALCGVPLVIVGEEEIRPEHGR